MRLPSFQSHVCCDGTEINESESCQKHSTIDERGKATLSFGWKIQLSRPNQSTLLLDDLFHTALRHSLLLLFFKNWVFQSDLVCFQTTAACDLDTSTGFRVCTLRSSRVSLRANLFGNSVCTSLCSRHNEKCETS